MEVRAQVAYHFKIDPAKLTPGRIQLPDQITRTVSVGDEIFTEKVDSFSLARCDCAALVEQLEKLTVEQTRTARPAGAAAAAEESAPEQDEVSAF